MQHEADCPGFNSANNTTNLGLTDQVEENAGSQNNSNTAQLARIGCPWFDKKLNKYGVIKIGSL